MLPRTLAAKLLEVAGRYPLVTLTGPRQSGKTTLSRRTFPDHAYVSLEAPDERAFALEDPRGFLGRFDRPAILDEVQRAPELFSYLQVLVDEHPEWKGRFVLTGSHNFLLLERVSQSLAGRCAVLHLLPFSLAELSGREPIDLRDLTRPEPVPPHPTADLETVLHTGFYPRLHDQHLPAREWLGNYYQTYLERDVRALSNLGDLETFGRFVRLCAGRSGQLLSLSGLAADCGVAQPTAKRWLSVLEAGFIIALLRPYHRNYGKRLIKAPKLYFLDTGLLCYLLNLREPQDLLHRAERGAVFETFVVAEVIKNFLHRGETPALWFWRDVAGHEVDLLVEVGGELLPIEVKAGQTVASDSLTGLHYWQKLAVAEGRPAVLIHAGAEAYLRSGVAVQPWCTF